MLENTDVVGRFWKHVDKLSQNECWNWNADCYKSGYGRFYVDGKPKRAHRWIYQYLKGQLPKTIYVCHSCDNPRCVNPAHLFIGTQSDNMLDCSKKRRLYSQRHPEKSWLNSEQAKKLKPKGEEHGSAKLNNNDVLFIRQSNHISVAELATMFDVNPTTIRSVRVRKTWKHI